MVLFRFLTICIILGFWSPAIAVDDYNLHILYTANNNGVLLNCHCPREPWGGLEKRMTLIQIWRAENPPFLLMDSGDFLSFKGEGRSDGQVIRAMELLDYDVINLGDQEFSNGTAFLETQLFESRLPVLSSHADLPVDHTLEPYKILSYNELTVAVLGVLDPSALAYYLGDNNPPMLTPEESINLILSKPEVAGADVRILLSNLGLAADKLLAAKVPLVDLIIGGHSQDFLGQPLYHNGALIVQPGKDGQFVGHLALAVESNRIKKYRHEFLKVSESLKDAPEVMTIAGKK